MGEIMSAFVFLQRLRAKAEGEPIEAVVLGAPVTYVGMPKPEKWQWPQGDILSFDDAKGYIEKAGEGKTENLYDGWICLIAWTASSVLFIDSYDGDYWVSKMPRNPVSLTPGAR